MLSSTRSTPVYVTAPGAPPDHVTPDAMSIATLTAPPARPAQTQHPGRGPVYRCECGHVLRVFGVGRHRVYFELGNERLDDPVMNRVCPACEGGLPGKNRP